MHKTISTSNSQVSDEDYQINLEKLKSSEAGASELTQYSFELLLDNLASKGNKVGNAQKLALYDLLSEMTAYSMGVSSGRKVYPLPTGCGKTSAIIAWVSTSYRLGHLGAGVAISASKIEALCDMKTQLMEHGVSEGDIGIKHSGDSESRYPSTGNQDRLIQLVTHSRVGLGRDVELFTRHKDQPRSLMIYDESFVSSTAYAVSKRDLFSEIEGLKGYVRGEVDESNVTSLLRYLDEIASLIEERCLELSAEPSKRVIIQPEPISKVDKEKYIASLRHYKKPILLKFLGQKGQRFRLVRTGQGLGLVGFETNVPTELKNVLVLDASYPIRNLLHLDSTLQEGGRLKDLAIKRWDQVVIHHMNSKSGRYSIERDFGNLQKADREISKEITHIIKQTEMCKSILIVTFKGNQSAVDVQRVLSSDLRQDGVDLSLKNTKGGLRINFLTWGCETSLNEFSHCEVIIFVGVLQLPHLSLAAKILGQKNDLYAGISSKLITEANDGEQAHSIYQALSRGSSRIMQDGQASKMEVYLINSNPRVQKLLTRVMPGARWLDWEPRFSQEKNMKQQDSLVRRVKEYLDGLNILRDNIKTKVIRERLGIDVADEAKLKMFRRALNAVLDGYDSGWVRFGHVLQRRYSEPLW